MTIFIFQHLPPDGSQQNHRQNLFVQRHPHKRLGLLPNRVLLHPNLHEPGIRDAPFQYQGRDDHSQEDGASHIYRFRHLLAHRIFRTDRPRWIPSDRRHAVENITGVFLPVECLRQSLLIRFNDGTISERFVRVDFQVKHSSVFKFKMLVIFQ